MTITLYTTEEIATLICMDADLEREILGEEFPEFAREKANLDALDEGDEL